MIPSNLGDGIFFLTTQTSDDTKLLEMNMDAGELENECRGKKHFFVATIHNF